MGVGYQWFSFHRWSFPNDVSTLRRLLLSSPSFCWHLWSIYFSIFYLCATESSSIHFWSGNTKDIRILITTKWNIWEIVKWRSYKILLLFTVIKVENCRNATFPSSSHLMSVEDLMRSNISLVIQVCFTCIAMDDPNNRTIKLLNDFQVLALHQTLLRGIHVVHSHQ